MHHSLIANRRRRISLWAGVLAVIVCCGLYAISASSAKLGSGHRPSPSVASMAACDAQPFQDVTPEIWDCFKSTLREHFGADVPASPSGVINGDITADYSWDRNSKTLVITVKSKPFLVSCKQVSNRIGDFIADCRGPQVSLVKREGSRETWSVEAPNVKQRETAYPKIKFRPGDSVSIEAGGCVHVQTGAGARLGGDTLILAGLTQTACTNGAFGLWGLSAQELRDQRGRA